MKVKHTAIIYIIIGLFHILPIQPKAQNKIEFNKLINDLGTFSEDSKPKTCTFKFTNHQAKAIKYMWLCCSTIYKESHQTGRKWGN